jgi:alpha,alpha-trehalase
VLTFALGAACVISSAQCRKTSVPPELPSQERLQPVLEYIRNGWDVLTRSHADLPAAIVDPKIDHDPDTPWVLYVSPHEDPGAISATLEAALPSNELGLVRVQQLSEDLIVGVEQIEPHGLLYLPYPYVVPGGRFNEMYGWDSYFIQVGLLRDGEVELAKNLVDNFVYEIEHYGTLLNANRTYYLTRSQPPFLTAMILGVFEATKDRDWLEGTLPAIERYYGYWTSPPHHIEGLGLSRYHDLGEGPAPEVVSSERDEEGRTHYDRVRDYYREHAVTRYDESLYFDPDTDELTGLFYVGDRSMRESGFDPSNRFGPFSVDIIHYAPVCLNSLLHKMEVETARIYALLDREREAETWWARSRTRASTVNEKMWDAEAGLYRDYRFDDDTLSDYEFATTFYPLWTGIASEDQARRVAENLVLLEAPGALLTSTVETGSQWDAPFGWAPLQMIAVEGLRRYGYHDDADRLSAKFIGLVTKEFEEHTVIVEKYNVVERESDVAADLRFGYSANVIGFGWTNAVFIELLAGME